MATAPNKVCTVCGLDKTAADYYRDVRAPHGLTTQCKQCMNERKKAKRAVDPESARAAWRDDYLRNKGRYERAAEAYRARHPDKVRGFLADYHQRRKNEPWFIEQQRAYRATDAAKATHRAAVLLRRARRSEGVTTSVLSAWVQSQAKVCAWCHIDCAGSYHVDHVVPISKGGAHSLDNLCIACPPCNCRKGAKMPEDFLRQRSQR